MKDEYDIRVRIKELEKELQDLKITKSEYYIYSVKMAIKNLNWVLLEK